MKRGIYGTIDRLVRLMQLLSPEWEDMSSLITSLGDYPDDDESAKRAFRRDIASLAAMGFLIERTTRGRHPAFRLAGHRRWPETYQGVSYER